jgi:ABC-type multidrug transport system fused ATPase/permease subunit
MADHIIVLEKGEIHEQGSHTELLAANGQYATLFKLQARGYQ